MSLALVLALTTTAGGTLLTYLYEERAPLPARLCEGAVIGFVAYGLVGFVFASLFGLNWPVLLLSAALTALPLILLKEPRRRAEVGEDLSEMVQGALNAAQRPTLSTAGYVVFYAAVAALLWLAFDRAMIEKPEGIFTGVLNNFGDMPFHLSVITSFAKG
ncbi:MAG TPA: hypothetical protein VF507_03700, partial [Pyrinomonadaceae bacterium]